MVAYVQGADYTPPGVESYPVPDTQIVASLTARTVQHTNFTQDGRSSAGTRYPFRVWPLFDLGATSYRYFWTDVLQAGERFKLWEVTEDPSGTTAQVWPLASTLGPYKLRSVNPGGTSAAFPTLTL